MPTSGNRFVGSVLRKRGLNQFTGRVDHNFSSRDIVFGSFISNRDSRTEPTLGLNNLPGFGDYRPAERYLLYFSTATGGVITFPSLAAFLSGTPASSRQSQFPVTNGLRVSAFDTYVQDDFKMTNRLTWNLGLRWEYNGVPGEKYNRLAVFVPSLKKMLTVGQGIDRPYARQWTNFGPRVGFSYDPTGKGKTAVRGGVDLYFDQPVTNMVSDLTTNPPFSFAVNFTSNVALAAPFSQPGGGPALIAARTIDPNFKSAGVLS